MTMLRVTVDTNLLDPNDIRRLRDAAHGLDVEIKTVTVNVRERGDEVVLQAIAEPAVWDESRWDQAAWGTSEPFILNETPLGTGLLASLEGATRFEAILAVISNRSFPPPGERNHLFDGQRRQLRDAMCLEAHTRDGRDVFLSRDAKGFIDGGRRQMLEALCSTRILTPNEFLAFCDKLRTARGDSSSAGERAT